jgi:hypothetical protein
MTKGAHTWAEGEKVGGSVCRRCDQTVVVVPVLAE